MFVSIFFPVFLIISLILYFAVPGKFRPSLLFLFSCIFCAQLGIRTLIILVIISIFAYFAALTIEKAKLRSQTGRSRLFAASAIAACVLLLVCYKYLLFFLRLSGWADAISESFLNSLMIPIGLSFYLFQVIGYLTDVYHGKCCAERNFIYFFLYLSYFPKFISGPIEREQSFFKQLQELEHLKVWDRGRLSTAFTYMLYGYFMKLVIADRLAVIVSKIFEAPESFNSLLLLAGALFYTIQIYCDFAGYSFIATGCSKLFGISLMQNFVTPYFAENITDFWRRWHVSLSSWLRDYIYIPLGGSRKGLFRKCLNTMIVFLLCGMWHGAGFSFIAWGFLHGFYSIIDTLLKKRNIKLPFSRLITFLAVSFAWIFFRATGLKSALKYIAAMFRAGIRFQEMPAMLELLQLDGIEIAVIAVSIILVFLMDFSGYRKNLLFPEFVQEKENSVRYMIFYFLIILLFIFGIYGPGYHTEQFIYMQF